MWCHKLKICFGTDLCVQQEHPGLFGSACFYGLCVIFLAALVKLSLLLPQALHEAFLGPILAS